MSVAQPTAKPTGWLDRAVTCLAGCGSSLTSCKCQPKPRCTCTPQKGCCKTPKSLLGWAKASVVGGLTTGAWTVVSGIVAAAEAGGSVVNATLNGVQDTLTGFGNDTANVYQYFNDVCTGVCPTNLSDKLAKLVVHYINSVDNPDCNPQELEHIIYASLPWPDGGFATGNNASEAVLYACAAEIANQHGDNAGTWGAVTATSAVVAMALLIAGCRCAVKGKTEERKAATQALLQQRQQQPVPAPAPHTPFGTGTGTGTYGTGTPMPAPHTGNSSSDDDDMSTS